MRLDFAFMADDAAADENGKLNVRGGGISHVTLPHIPGEVPELAGVIRLLVDDDDFGRELPIRMVLSGPDGRPFSAVEGPMRVPEQAAVHEGERLAMIVITNFGRRTFTEYGLHQVNWWIEGERIARVAFAVRPEEAPPAFESGEIPQVPV